MPNPLPTRVATASFYQGQSSDYTPNIRFIELPPDSKEKQKKGNLYIHVDVITSEVAYERLARQIVTTIQRQYYHSKTPLPAALEEAIKTVHHQLQEINTDLPEEEKHLAGITCLVAKDDLLYIVQAGPVSVGVFQNNQARWFSPLNEKEPPPLGGSKPVKVFLNSITPQPGEVIISLDSGWLGQLRPEILKRALLIPQADIIAEQIRKESHPRHRASTLILTFHELPLPHAEETPPEGEKPTEEKPSPLFKPEKPHLWQGVIQQAKEKAHTVRESIFSAPTSVEEDYIKLPPAKPAKKKRKKPRWQLPFMIRTRSHKDKRRSSWLWVLVILVPLLIVIGTMGLWWRGKQAQQALYKQQITSVQTALRSATEATDVKMQEHYLREATARLEKAREIKPNAPELGKLKQTIAQESDRINKVFYPPFSFLLHQYSGSHVMRRLLVASRDIYVLDVGNGKVYYHKLASSRDQLEDSNEEVPLLQKGENVNGIPVGDPIDLAWLPAGSISRAGGPLVLDRSGHLFLYNEQFGPTDVKIDEVVWQSPQAIRIYNNRLYVLDPAMGEVWRYTNNGSNFVKNGDYYKYFPQPVPLVGATDMAIDGNIYVLFPDGRLVCFSSGQEKPFTIKGLAQPVEHVKAFFTNELDKYIYLADVANNRIVQIDKNGHFIRQMKPDTNSKLDLTKVESLYVSEEQSEMFILTNKELWRVPWRSTGGQ